MGALDTLLFGYRLIAQGNAAPVLQRNRLSFQGTGVVSVLDDPVNSQTVITINGGSSTLTAYGGDVSATSTATQQFIASLSGNATGFAHGVAPAIAVNGTGATLNWVDDNAVINAATGRQLNLTINAVNQVQVSATQILMTPPSLQWTAAVTGPTLTQAPTSSATQGQDLTLTPQTSTQATNQGSGNLVVSLQAPLGTAVRSYAKVVEGGTGYAYLGRSFGGGGFGSLFLGPVAPAAGVHALQGDGATQVTMNVPTSGSLFLAVNAVAQVKVTAGTLEVLQSNSFIAQLSAFTGNGNFGAVYLGNGMTPGNGNYAVVSDGATATNLNAPSGGTVALGINNAATLTSTGTLITAFQPISVGGGTVAASGSLRVANATTIMAARNAANTQDLTLLRTDGSNNLQIGDDTQVANTNVRGLTSSNLMAANVANVQCFSGGVILGGTLTLSSVATATSATAGAASALPGVPAQYATIKVVTTNYKIALWNP